MNMETYILASSNPISHVAAHELFSITVGSYHIPFTNHMLMLSMAALLLVTILPYVVRGHHMVPQGFYNCIESVCSYLRDEMAIPLLHDKADRYIKYLWTLFFFILICNVLGMIPLDSIVYLVSGRTIKHVGGTATASIWVTGAMAVVSFFMIHVNGIKDQGLWHYIKNFIPKVPLVMVPMFYVLEIVGALVKPFSLAIRLFANMLAGHTMLAVLTMLAMMSHSYIVGGVTLISCTALSLLELFVAFLQAYIFTFLTTLFIASAINPEH